VVIPVILLLWAFVQKTEAIQRLLTIYWQCIKFAGNHDLPVDRRPASGLYFRANGSYPHSISLWYWVDLNEEIEDQQEALNSLSTRGAGRLLSIVCWVRSLSYLCCSVLSLKPDSRSSIM